MKKQGGFSLIELLIVVAIILVIAAIAIPNMLRSRIAAAEASAVGSIRTINTAETAFAATYPQCGYTSLANLGSSQILTDDNLIAGSKAGYAFVVTPTGGTAACNAGSTPNVYHTIAADPIGYPSARHFLSDPGGVIHSRVGAAAAISDPPIQ
jgi:type IV pilus assembly protein PilA